SSKQIRRLSQRQWEADKQVVVELVAEDATRHERTRFAMKALSAMYLRISALVETPPWSPKLRDFQRDTDGHWWFPTVGKGNKAPQVSVSDGMMQALIAYRVSRGLSEYPVPGEQSPLIHKTRGKGGITSTRQIRSIVQLCFDKAIALLNELGAREEAQ